MVMLEQVYLIDRQCFCGLQVREAGERRLQEIYVTLEQVDLIDQQCFCGLQAREAGEKRLQEIHVMLEEVDMRLAESRKDMHDFRRDIISACCLPGCVHSVSPDGAMHD